MGHTAEYNATLPTILPKELDALKKEISDLQEQRKKEGLFLDVKAEEAKVEAAKVKVVAILADAEDKAKKIVEEGQLKAASFLQNVTADANNIAAKLNKDNEDLVKKTKDLLKYKDELEYAGADLKHREWELSVKEGNLEKAKSDFNKVLDSVRSFIQ